MVPLDTACTTSYCKCSSASRPTPTVIDIFDDHNIVILI